MELTLFEIASRRGFRYNSRRGEMTTEQLWDIPLTSENGFNLNEIARDLSLRIKSATQDNFVPSLETENKVGVELNQKLDVVKRIIEIKVAERSLAAEKVVKAEKRRKLLDLLAQKRDEEMSQASIADLEKELADLDA